MGKVFYQPVGGTPVPVREARVTIDGNTIIQTEADGSYRINKVSPNAPLRLRAVHPNNRLAINLTVFLAPAETLTRNLTFKPSVIRGKITQPDGVTGAAAELKIRTPIPDLRVGLGSFGDLGSETPISTQSGGDGQYLINDLNPGTYRVTVKSGFFPTPVSKGGTLIVHDDHTVNISMVSTLAGKIQGRIFQPDGTTPVGAGIKVSLGGGFLADVTVQTDSTGRYEFAEVFAAASYALTATDPATGNTNRISIAVETNKDLVADMRLLGKGTLRVRVIDGAGAPVLSGRVTLNATSYPPTDRIVDITPETGGVITFNNLSEGDYAVSASNSGISGRNSASVVLNSTVEATIQLQPSGTIEGRVLMPDGLVGVGLADVTLFANGRPVGVAVSSDAEGDVGRYSFPGVPAGEFSLLAFDNRSGRFGRASGSVTTQGQTTTVDIKLIPIGAVTGRVTQNGTPVQLATVTISANGVNKLRLTTTTGTDGRYRFTGIPAGSFTVNARGPGGLSGTTSGSLTGTTEPLADTIADITLTSSVTVTGTVFKAGGAGTLAGARITLIRGGSTFNTLTNENGLYRVDFVPLGEISVKAEAPTGFDRGLADPVTAATAGETLNINVTMAGVGTITGDAFDSNGTTKLTSGTVTFTNTDLGSPIVINGSVQPNGRYEIKDAPAGEFSLKLTVAGRVGAGSASGTLAFGQTVEQAIKLEDAGTITGRVKLVDGTPVFSADVTLTVVRTGSTLKLFTHTNGQGFYTYQNVPLGTASVSVFDPNTSGVGAASGIALTTNGQTVTVPDIVLDNAPIRVDSVTPADGATNVAKSTTVTIVFSEPALASTVTGSNVRLLRGTSVVSSTLSLSADGRTATLTPSALVDSTLYTIVVTTNLKDLAGLKLVNEFRSAFTTRDETGPVVTAVSPVEGASGVALDSVVQVTFNEPLDAAQSLTQLIKLTFGPAPGTEVAGGVSLNEARTVATFVPSASLVESTLYTVTVNGQRDASGNVTSTEFKSMFSTRDTTPPVIDPLPIDGQNVQTFTPNVTATYRDNFSGINTGSVVLRLDGNQVTPNTVTSTALSFTPSAPLAKGSHNVTLQVSDNAGNQSAIRSATFTIDDAAPVISSFTVAGVNAANGMTVTSNLRPVFAASYSDNSGISISNTRLLLGPLGSPVQVAATVTATNLTFQPATDLIEGQQYQVQLIVADNTGNTATSGVIQFRIDVDAAEIATVSPNQGSQHGGTSVTLSGTRLMKSTGAAPDSVTVGGWPARIVSATAGASGAPDQVVIVTPASAPGAATITVVNDRGIGSLANGFTYQADPKTPFAVEADTRLLWRLDEPGNGVVPLIDAGPLAITASSGSTSLAAEGRFGGGRNASLIGAQDDAGAMSFEQSSFTVELWMKTGLVSQTATLIERARASFGDLESYRITLEPSGTLKAFIGGTVNGVSSQAEAAGGSATDDQWHYVAMVVDRDLEKKVKLYVDGIERGSAAIPEGLKLTVRTDHRLRAGFSSPNIVIDEVRISSSAHSGVQVENTFKGTDGNLGLLISRVTPAVAPLGTTTELSLNGYNLTGASLVVVDALGAEVPSSIFATSATEARISISPSVAASQGPAIVRFANTAGTATATVRLVDLERIVAGVEADTRLLWHLDETSNGVTDIIDSGPLSIDGRSGSTSFAVPGRFGNARKSPIVVASDFGAMSFEQTSFTVEFWMKTGPVTQNATLIERARSSFGDTDAYAVVLETTGTLKGYVGGTVNGVSTNVEAGLRNVFFNDHTVMPSLIRRPFLKVAVGTLIVNNCSQ